MKGREGREGPYTSNYQTHFTALTHQETGNVSSHFLFFVHLNEEFGLRHSPQIMPPENRCYKKEVATEVVDLITHQKCREFTTSTLSTAHATATNSLKAARTHRCFRGEQIGATSMHVHVCWVCALCSQCTGSNYSAAPPQAIPWPRRTFLSLTLHYG